MNGMVNFNPELDLSKMVFTMTPDFYDEFACCYKKKCAELDLPFKGGRLEYFGVPVKVRLGEKMLTLSAK